MKKTSHDWGLRSPDASAQCCYETLLSSELLFSDNPFSVKHKEICMVGQNSPYTHRLIKLIIPSYLGLYLWSVGTACPFHRLLHSCAYACWGRRKWRALLVPDWCLRSCFGPLKM